MDTYARELHKVSYGWRRRFLDLPSLRLAIDDAELRDFRPVLVAARNHGYGLRRLDLGKVSRFEQGVHADFPGVQVEDFPKTGKISNALSRGF